MENNVITAYFKTGCVAATTRSRYRYDYGQILVFDGLDLPDAYEVHFASEEMGGETVTQIGNADGVIIPDQYLTTGKDIYAWVFLHTGEDDGETVYRVHIPVINRPEPSDLEPTPVQQDAITQAIAALNAAVDKTAQDVTDADASAQEAAQSAQNAAESAAESAASADRAEQAAAAAGYMYFYINGDGCLIMERTGDINVDFYLDDGKLYVRAA